MSPTNMPANMPATQNPRNKNESLILIFLVVATLAAIAFFFIRLWLPENEKDKKNETEEKTADELHIPEVNIDELKDLITSEQELILLDVQNHDDYLQATLPSTTSIPLSELNARISELPKNKTIIAIDNGEECESCSRAAEILLTSGYNDVKKLDGGVTAWAEAGYPIAAGKNITFQNISAKELSDKMFINDDIVIIDIRDKEDYQVGHIKNARHIEFAGISQNVSEIPKNKQLIIYDKSDNRSQVAVKQLIKDGYLDATNLLGGIDEWQNQNLELVQD